MMSHQTALLPPARTHSPPCHPPIEAPSFYHPFSLLTWLPRPLPPRAAHSSRPVSHHHGYQGEVCDPDSAQNNLSAMPERPSKGQCLDPLWANFLGCWDRTRSIVHLSATLPLSICVRAHTWVHTMCCARTWCTGRDQRTTCRRWPFPSAVCVIREIELRPQSPSSASPADTHCYAQGYLHLALPEVEPSLDGLPSSVCVSYLKRASVAGGGKVAVVSSLSITQGCEPF